ncbi:MAG: RNA-binding transcriptional accessory protein [Saprospirales bacterium]|nr:RNA-binding transcriptional accessory protein [Saprospirales bacterium]
MIIPKLISQTLQLPESSVRQTILLFEEGATIPFIARYRKERTGSLDEVQIAEIQQQWKKLRDLEDRKVFVLQSIEEQGKLTEELRKRIEQCYDPTELEDIYLPYKKKRKTRADTAREKGLEPLAQAIFKQTKSRPDELAKSYITEAVPDIESALQGARDIIAEWVNEDERARNKVRHYFRKGAVIRSKVARGKEEEGAKYRDYFQFEEPLQKCPSHRLLAMRRGEEEGFLRLVIEPDPEEALSTLDRMYLVPISPCASEVKEAIRDGYERLLAPSIETEFRNSSKEKADKEAILVFAENLRQLLMAPPIGQKRVLGLDPGFRTGCKVVVLNEFGDLLHTSVVYPHPPQLKVEETLSSIEKLVEKHQLEAIAVGNGTAGRETISLLRTASFASRIPVFLVNESGASIYSASEVAREEFPDQDLTVRGAVSIGRRLMDPLAELVKIEAKSIGVGQYQHDVNQVQLRESLDRVVESCVNRVGINVNTASKHLLTYVSGLGPALAQNIVQFRSENGAFRSREELKKVPRMGDKAFELSAGFLRIREGKHPLDNTAVHPESYSIVLRMAKDLGCSVEELVGGKELQRKIDPKLYISGNVGLPTINDILKELAKPGLDPRGEARTFEFSREVHTLEDLRTGMLLPGIVTNITNFGVFVDIGVKQDGLVHISQLANTFVKNPTDVVSLQQEVLVKVLDVDLARKRVNLSMKEASL